jgi:AAA domain-containing protein
MARVKPVRWIVEGLLPEGVCLLVGKPKTGKSLCALNLAQCVAHGLPALGGLAIGGGKVQSQGCRWQVLDALREGGPMRPAELAAVLGWKQTWVRSLVFRMERSHEVVEVAGGYEAV